MIKRLLTTFAFFQALMLPFAAVAEQKIYSFGVVPQFDARRIQTIWRPILDQLEQATGLKFSLKGSASIPAFENEFGNGDFDFVYMNPYHLYIANKQQGYMPLVRDTGKSLYGIVVVRKDSGIKNVRDLDGKLVAFPAPNALGASLMPRAAFANEFNILVKPKYVKTHTSVYLNVALGEADAGGGVQKTLQQQRPEIRDALEVIYETERVAPHPISVHPRVSATVQEKVRQAFLNMGMTPEGRELLGKIPIRKISTASIDDYTSFSRLGLDSLYQR